MARVLIILVLALLAGTSAQYCGSDKLCPICGPYSCTACVNSYPGVYSCRKTSGVPNCYQYLSAGICGSCRVGYYLDSSANKCIKGNASLGCYAFKNDSTCLSCRGGKYITKSNPDCLGSTRMCSMDNCEVCTPDYINICGVCKSGYTSVLISGLSLASSSTICQITKVQNCMMAGNNISCDACWDEYYNTNLGTCEYNPELEAEKDPSSGPGTASTGTGTGNTGTGSGTNGTSSVGTNGTGTNVTVTNSTNTSTTNTNNNNNSSMKSNAALAPRLIWSFALLAAWTTLKI